MRGLGYACRNCHAVHTRWTGRCRVCGEFNTLHLPTPIVTDEPDRRPVLPRPRPVSPGPMDRFLEFEPPKRVQGPRRIGEIAYVPMPRIPTGSPGLDRVFGGGGVVEGSINAVGGDPGAGKSSVLLRMLAHVARVSGRPCLYLTAEETEQRLQARARTMGVGDEIFVHRERDLEQALFVIAQMRPFMLVADSLQTFRDDQYSTGSPHAVMNVANRFEEVTKTTGSTTFLISQVNKSGDFHGMRGLEHLMDGTFMFEKTNENSPFRIMTVTKNRDGDESATATFRMTGPPYEDKPYRGVLDSTTDEERCYAHEQERSLALEEERKARARAELEEAASKEADKQEKEERKAKAGSRGKGSVRARGKGKDRRDRP